MEELQNLIKFLNTKGLKDQKIPLDVWVGIIEYFASKQEPKQCDIAVVVGQSEPCRHDSEPILDSDGFYVCPDCGKYGEDC